LALNAASVLLPVSVSVGAEVSMGGVVGSGGVVVLAATAVKRQAKIAIVDNFICIV
jgi:hypothetical protein